MPFDIDDGKLIQVYFLSHRIIYDAIPLNVNNLNFGNFGNISDILFMSFFELALMSEILC